MSERAKLIGSDVSLGRIVWYTAPTSGFIRTQPAIVTKVHDENGGVNLHVFADGTPYPASSVPFSEQPYPNTWRWPDLKSPASK